MSWMEGGFLFFFLIPLLSFSFLPLPCRQDSKKFYVTHPIFSFLSFFLILFDFFYCSKFWERQYDNKGERPLSDVVEVVPPLLPLGVDLLLQLHQVTASLVEILTHLLILDELVQVHGDLVRLAVVLELRVRIRIRPRRRICVNNLNSKCLMKLFPNPDRLHVSGSESTLKKQSFFLCCFLHSFSLARHSENGNHIKTIRTGQILGPLGICMIHFRWR